MKAGCCACLAILRRQIDFLLPGGCPELAALLQLGSLRKLALPEVAGQHRVAVLIDAIGEVQARHADDTTLPALQLAFVEEIPALHQPWPLVHKY